MPIKSKAQRRKFAELLIEGKISPETFEEWNRSAGSAELPERLHPKKKTVAKSRRKLKSKRKAQSKRKVQSTRKAKSRAKAGAKGGRKTKA